MNSRKHLIRDAILIVISSARKQAGRGIRIFRICDPQRYRLVLAELCKFRVIEFSNPSPLQRFVRAMFAEIRIYVIFEY